MNWRIYEKKWKSQHRNGYTFDGLPGYLSEPLFYVEKNGHWVPGLKMWQSLPHLDFSKTIKEMENKLWLKKELKRKVNPKTEKW